MPQPWLVGVKRREQKSFPPITRSEFAKFLEAARATHYVREPELAMRDASLLAFEFLYKTRVSEGVGRVYPESNRKDLALETVDFRDVYEGVKVSDFKLAEVKGIQVLRVRFRVLKRGRRKKICSSCEKRNAQDSSFCRFCGSKLDHAKFDCKLREIWTYDSVRLDDPFAAYIQEWLKHLEALKYEGKVWNIGRQRAWQIMKALGIMNHTQRHWRATQLRDTHDAFELKEALHRATIPFEYVHHTESRALEKTEEADKIWK
jgi:ribosomal protein L40E